MFNKAELDLYVVFCEVQALGGYDAVTMDKRWKRVCEALGRDLSTATSAGHSMRILYEKFLLDFETHRRRVRRPDRGEGSRGFARGWPHDAPRAIGVAAGFARGEGLEHRER